MTLLLYSFDVELVTRQLGNTQVSTTADATTICTYQKLFTSISKAPAIVQRGNYAVLSNMGVVVVQWYMFVFHESICKRRTYSQLRLHRNYIFEGLATVGTSDDKSQQSCSFGSKLEEIRERVGRKEVEKR